MAHMITKLKFWQSNRIYNLKDMRRIIIEKVVWIALKTENMKIFLIL